VSSFSIGADSAVGIGNDSGWVLEFYSVDDGGKLGDKAVASFSSSSYYASIDATLQDDLRGGSFTITIQGLIDDDYALISQAIPGRPIAAKLYLYWRDVTAGGYLGNLIGLSSDLSADDLKKALVSVLYVAKVKRKLGDLTYDTEIQCVEWAYYAMTQPLMKPLEADDYRKAAEEITKRTGVDITCYPAGSGRLTKDEAGTTGSEKVKYPKDKSFGSVIRDIASALEISNKKYGRGMALIRDGKIHLGPRPYPLEGDPKELTVTNGFLEAAIDGSSDAVTVSDAPPQGGRPHYSVILKARPDIKPGDLVKFDPPKEDDAKTTPNLLSALAGAFAAPFLPPMSDSLTDSAVTVAVSSVRHRQSKTAGFFTEVKGVLLVEPDSPWDDYSDSPARPRRSSPAADGGSDAAGAIKEHLQTWTSNLHTVEIGQVRSYTSKKLSDEVPSQVESVWEGLTAADQNPNGTRRLPIDKKNAIRVDLPYATAFAWGKCGLVLPRYPGMRVVLAHRRGLEQEPVDIGAIWDSGKGPDSEAGDYWLSLPIGVDSSKREKASDEEAPAPYEGPASHDLIDAEGNRVLEVGSLTVRVPKKDQGAAAGTRPDKGADKGSITIEHADGGSQIVMKQDGTILIKGKGITLDAGEGQIVLKGKSVDVQ
jgi:hypothetical protein